MSDFRITDRNVYNGKDYHTLSSDKKAMDLDNLEADDGHVVTGKNKIENYNKKNLNLYFFFRSTIQGYWYSFKFRNIYYQIRFRYGKTAKSKCNKQMGR